MSELNLRVDLVNVLNYTVNYNAESKAQLNILIILVNLLSAFDVLFLILSFANIGQLPCLVTEFLIKKQEAGEGLCKICGATRYECHISCLHKEVCDFRVLLDFKEDIAQATFLKLKFTHSTATCAHLSETTS